MKGAGSGAPRIKKTRTKVAIECWWRLFKPGTSCRQADEQGKGFCGGGQGAGLPRRDATHGSMFHSRAGRLAALSLFPSTCWKTNQHFGSMGNAHLTRKGI